MERAPAQMELATVLSPRSIALVGATEDSAWSRALISNFTTLGFEGRVHLVHHRRTEQFGLPCHPTVESVPDDVDSAYVMTGTAATRDIIEDCARKGVGSVVMLTAGFKEVGPEGAELERALVARCGALGITLLGPNCLGFVNYVDRVPAYGILLPPPLLAGGIALISHSGAMLLHFHRLSQQRGVGLAYQVSIGNEAMCASSDFALEFVRSPRVKVIGALLEGIRDPAGFLRCADAALAAGKPLVVLKVGRTEAATRSVIAHTGSLASAEAVVDAVFRQKGVIRVQSMEELMETSAMLAIDGWPAGSRTAVVTTSGGACGLVADLAHGTLVEIPDFAPQTKARLAELLPVFGTPQNPLDTTGVIVNQPALLAACVNAVVEEDSFDAIVINSDPPRDALVNPAGAAERLTALAKSVRETPFFTAVMSTVAGDLTSFSRETLSAHGVHLVNGLALGIQALDHAIFYSQARARGPGPEPGLSGREPPALVAGWSGTLSEVASKRLLEAYGISIPSEWLAASREEAAAAAAQIGFPVVVKVQSPDIAHKTEAGGVRLGLRDEEEVRRAFDEVSRCQVGARIDGVLVAQQVSPVAELIAGISLDPQFGPVVMAGLGGIFVEAVGDFSLRLPPVDQGTGLEMLEELKGASILKGARGRPPADLDALAAVLVQLGELSLDLGQRLGALDVNPLFAMERGALAGDALVVLR